MEYLRTAVTSATSLVALIVLGKLMGARQVSQLTMPDYMVGITIGSIAAEMALGNDENFSKGFVAMAVYAILTLLIAMLTNKFIKFRRAITGETLILLQEGKIFKGNLKKAKMDVSEMLSELRALGYFNPADLHTVILEPNGKLSALPFSQKRPIIPGDMELNPPPEMPLISIISDGKILEDNLKFAGKDKKWLEKELHALGFSEIKEVFLATVDKSSNLEAFKLVEKKDNRDMFE